VQRNKSVRYTGRANVAAHHDGALPNEWSSEVASNTGDLLREPFHLRCAAV